MELTIFLIKTAAIIIGFSSAFINDSLAFRFLKDFRVNKKEKRTFEILADVILISALVILLTLISSMLLGKPFISPEILISSTLILLIVAVNEIVFRRIISQLAEYRIKTNIIEVGKLSLMRRIAFCSNIISVMSWLYLLLIFNFGVSNIAFFTNALWFDYIIITSVLVIMVNVIYKLKNN